MSSYFRKAGANDDYRDEWNDAERYQLSITPQLYNSVQRRNTKWLYHSVRFLLSICSAVCIFQNVCHLLRFAFLHKIIEILKRLDLNSLKFTSNNRFSQLLLLLSRLISVFLHSDCTCSTVFCHSQTCSYKIIESAAYAVLSVVKSLI